MDNLVPKFYKEYGQYVNSSRMFPLNLDGLKPVERRVLLSTSQICRDKFVKSVRVDGHTLGHYHPHGSVYGTIVQLVQQGFLEGQGNFGSNCGVEPVGAAAARYTECKLSKEIEEMCFKLIKNVPWEILELDKEPLYLPTKLPLCLIGNFFSVGIGFGYRTLIPCFSPEDLIQRLFSLLNEKSEKITIKPKSDCKILSSNKEIEELLTTGKAQIKFQGNFKVDKIKYKVLIESWPYSMSFQRILNEFSKELDNRDVGFIDMSDTNTKIIFEILKQRNRKSIFEKFIKKLKKVLTKDVSFEIITVDLQKNVKLTSVDELLLSSFNMFKNTNQNMLEEEKQRLLNLLQEYELLEKVKPMLTKYLSRKNIDIKKVVEDLSKDLKIEQELLHKLLSKYSVAKLLLINVDIQSIKLEIENNKKNLKNIDNFVIEQYKVNKEKR